jgi:hypothetical protein
MCGDWPIKAVCIARDWINRAMLKGIMSIRVKIENRYPILDLWLPGTAAAIEPRHAAGTHTAERQDGV